MGDIFSFIVRVVAFAVSFYFLAEFIITCSVPTWVGVIILLGIMLLISLFYMMYRKSRLVRCSYCNKVSDVPAGVAQATDYYRKIK